MIRLTAIARTLLLEDQKARSFYDTITKAIKNKNIIVIHYDGDEEQGKGKRTIEPVCIGVTTKGNLGVRAWVVEGVSYSAAIGLYRLPGWRMFLIDKMTGVVRSTRRFDKLRPGYNTTGDKGFSKIYVNAQFDVPTSEEEVDQD